MGWRNEFINFQDILICFKIPRLKELHCISRPTINRTIASCSISSFDNAPAFSPIAKDLNSIGEVLNFTEPMRNINNTDAGITKSANDLIEILGFLL